MIYFTLEEIELLHMQIIDVSGGSHGVRDRGRLESVIATQTQEVFGKKLYESPYDIAAALMRGIIADHPFVDGNKRTGVMSAIVFLERNGTETRISDQELENFAVRVAVEHLDIEQIAQWLGERSEHDQ